MFSLPSRRNNSLLPWPVARNGFFVNALVMACLYMLVSGCTEKPQPSDLVSVEPAPEAASEPSMTPKPTETAVPDVEEVWVEKLAARAGTLLEAENSQRETATVAPGVEWLSWHIVEGPLQPGPWNINSLMIDLSQPGVSVRIVEAEGDETVSEICKRTGAVAAVNGPMHEWPYSSRLRSEGQWIADEEINDTTIAALGLGPGGATIGLLVASETGFSPVTTWRKIPWDEMESVIAGGPLLISRARMRLEGVAPQSGEPIRVKAGGKFLARTAAGLRGEHLYFLTVDGGPQPGVSRGMTLEHIAGFFRGRCGAVDALALAGEEATTMAIRGEVVNFPCGRDEQGRFGAEQAVEYAICVFAKETGTISEEPHGKVRAGESR